MVFAKPENALKRAEGKPKFSSNNKTYYASDKDTI